MRNCLVIGGHGFIGSKIVSHLVKSGTEVFTPKRGDLSFLSESYDTIIYSAGFGDCNKPLEVIDSNMTLFSKVLFEANFEHLIYLSSTRVYMSTSETTESTSVRVQFDDSRKIFNLTKMLSEELAFVSKKNVTVIRPSNVYGSAINSQLFLPMIIKNAIKNKQIDMFVSPDYEKDYVSIQDVVGVILKCIKQKNKGFKLYNVASGRNIPAISIANILEKETQCKIVWHEGSKGEEFSPINISKIKHDFNFKPRNLLLDMPSIINSFKLSLLTKNKT